MQQITVQHILTTYLFAPLFSNTALVIILTGFLAILSTILALLRAGAPVFASVFLVGAVCFAIGHETPFGPLGNLCYCVGALQLEMYWLQRMEEQVPVV